MSKREELRRRRQQTARRQQTTLIGLVVALALGITAFLVWQNVGQNAGPVGEIVQITKEAWPMADGSSLGPADARVVIQEFSDFQ